MYKVFVVEDEPMIRQSIRAAVESAGAPFAFCGEASDGEMALSMMMDLEPDILVTDIKMPFMNGLDLSRNAKTQMPWLKILIVSGHDEFDYAQQAIEIGVDQYLLKPIRQKDLATALEATARQIEEQRSALAGGHDGKKRGLALYHRFMNQLFFGGSSTAELLEDARRLGVQLTHRCYQVVLFSLDIPPDSGWNPRTLAGQVDEVQSDDLGSLLYLNGSEQLIALTYGADAEEANERSYQLVKVVHHEMQEMGIAVTTVIGRTVSRISAIKDAYHAANGPLRMASGVRPAGHVLDLGDPAQSTAGALPDGKSFAHAYEKRLQYASPEELDALVAEFMDGLVPDGADSVLYRHYVLMDMLDTCVRVVASANPDADPQDIAHDLAGSMDLLSRSATRESFRKAAHDILTTGVQLRQTHVRSSRGGDVIGRAMSFIQENYADPDISLHVVAKHAGFSPAHFSMVFSQKTGTTFIDYLTGVRIDKAKELLATTDKKLSIIAMEIGYNEPNYFSYVFKKHVGMSPKEFRTRQQAGS